MASTARTGDLTAATAVPPESGRGDLVGRDNELAQVLPAAESLFGGNGAVILFAGDPGIGKTRMAEEIAAHARSRGAAIHWGRCHEGAGAPAYWPWVQILRSVMRELSPRALAALLGDGAAEMAQVVPEVRQRLGELPPPPAVDPEQARFQLFDRITTFLRAAAARQPLVLVLDDLHWADTPSLLLLQFLAREASDAPLLVVGTYRELEVDSAHPLTPVLAELCRARRFVRLYLRGLPAEAVRDLAAALSGQRVSPSFAEALLRRTEGNPFFVEELLRHCVEEGVSVSESGVGIETAGTPEGVQAVIRRRLARLTPSCNRVLAVAAVVGRSFDAGTLREVLEEENADVDRELRAAVGTRAIGEARGGELFTFAHALVRETLYAAQPRRERAELHRRIGEMLERRLGGEQAVTDPDTLQRDDLSQLAYHFVESGRELGDVDKAIGYSALAARQAARALAYEEAAAHYERALEALDRSAVEARQRDRRRAQLLLSLAEEQMHAGEPQQAKDTFLRAAEAARQCGSPEDLARAALGFEIIGSDLGGTEPDRVYVHLLEEAAVALGPRRDQFRARILARLSQVPHRSIGRERRVAMSAEAVDIARDLHDPYTLAFVLLGRNYALWDSDPPAARHARASEIVENAERAGERALALDGRLQRAFALMELGHRAELEAEMHAFRRLAEELRQPRYLWLSLLLQTARASLSGDFAAAERFLNEALEIGQRHNRSNALQVYLLQLFGLRRETGGLDGVELPLRALADEHPIPAWNCALAFLYGELGREAEARQQFELLAARDFRDLPSDPLWLVSVGSLAEACAYLGDAPRAARLYEMMLPYAGTAVVVGGAVSLGSASRLLGLLARTMGRLDEAVERFEEAIRFDAGMGATPAVARSQRDLGLLLQQRNRPGDRERGEQLLAESLATAERLGMRRMIELAAESPAPAPSGPRVAAPAATAATDENLFHREGDFWTLAFGGQLVRLRDAKGLHYLAALLAHPEREFHVSDLVAAPPILGSDTGAVLDGAAKSAYRSRLGELRGEMEEAERFNDVGRAGTLRDEMHAIAEELRAAVGTGGRDRRAGSQAERARLAVTQCIKASLKKIRAAHPSLGHHLSTCIRTGYFCAYQPGPLRSPWRL